MDTNDHLQRYVTEGSEPAFRQLVLDHIDLVYSTAFRRVGGNTALAQDITQTVFIDLARKARSLLGSPALSGWLYRHTCFRASEALRSERRRAAREQTAAAMKAINDDSDAVWRQLAGQLDDAMEQLNDADRDALVLRFFEGRDLRAVGAALGTNEDAAQKRVSRALEKLRDVLTKRGFTLSATALAAALAGHAVQAAPLGLGLTIAGATLAKAGATSVFSLNSFKLLFMAKSKASYVAVIALTIAATLLVVNYRNQLQRERDSIESARQRALAALRAQQSAPRGTNSSKRKVIPVRTFPSQPKPTAIELDAETAPEAAAAAPAAYQVTPPPESPRQNTGYIAPSSNSVVTGRVTLRGTPPPEKVMEMDATCGRPHAEPVTTRHYVVDENGGLGNVVVSVMIGLEGMMFPPPATNQIIDQLNCMYEPYVSAVLAGQKISVRNSDSLMHNVHATPKVAGNLERNVAQPVKGMQQDFRFDHPESFLRFKCDVHNWMFAYVCVMAHPYFAVSAPDGTFAFPTALPPGKYVIQAVHPKAGKLQRAFDNSKDSKAPVLNFVFDLPQTAEQ